MLKVNEEKIIEDYKALQEKKTVNLVNIETQVRSFAFSLGYDEEKTKGLIDYVQKQNGNGLSEDDTALLAVLSSYIDEVEEKESQASEVVSEDTFGTYTSVNI